MPKFYPEKDTEDKTKDYLLGIYSRQQEVQGEVRAGSFQGRVLPWRNDHTRYSVCSDIIMSGISD